MQRFLFVVGIVILAASLVACDAVWLVLPTATPTSFPPTATTTPSPTETRVWFPATETPTPLVGNINQTPTPELRPIGQPILFSDDFKEDSHWEKFTSNSMVASFGVNKLTLALKNTKGTLYSFNGDPIPSDYYLEFYIEPNLCSGEDQYGILFRTQSKQEFYRLLMGCDGVLRLDLVRGSSAVRLVETTQSAQVFSSPDSVVKVNIWLVNDGVRIYVNDVLQMENYKLQWYSGGIGVFARSTGENALTISFRDLSLRDVIPLPPTPIPSATSTPN